MSTQAITNRRIRCAPFTSNLIRYNWTDPRMLTNASGAKHAWDSLCALHVRCSREDAL